MSSTITYTFSDVRPVWVSRFRQRKREADRDANWMRRYGGKRVTVIGKRGGPWRVRAKMPVGDFAHFCAIEAAREVKAR